MSVGRFTIPVLLMLAGAAWCINPVFEDLCQPSCGLYKYCNERNHECLDCSVLCGEDEYSCIKKCPEYLFKSTRDRLSKLEKSSGIAYSTALWVLVALNVVFLLVVTFQHRSKILQLFRWRPRSEKESAPVGYTHENPNTKSPKAVPKNGANVARPASATVSIYPETEADNSVQTGTTSISHRYPAEDSTESYSYDNAACNVTPDSKNPLPKF